MLSRIPFKPENASDSEVCAVSANVRSASRQIAIRQPLLKTLQCPFLTRCLMVLLLVLAVPIMTYAQDRRLWRTGQTLQKQLQLPVQAVFRDLPLRACLQKVSRVQNICIWLDRRVDPSQKVSVTVEQQELQVLLDRIVNQKQLEFTVIGSAVYIAGPRQACIAKIVLDLQRQRIQKLSPAAKRIWLSSKPLTWDDLTEPRSLIVDLCAQAGITVDNPKLIPHDLWLAADWPPMSLLERLTLLLNGFDLTFNIRSNGNVVLGRIPWRQKLKKEYSLPKNSGPLPDRLRKRSITRNGTRVVVTGRFEEHAEVLAWVEQRARELSNGSFDKAAKLNSPQPPGRQVYTLRIQDQPLQPIVSALGKKLGLKVNFNESISDEWLQKRISFQVENASLDQLLSAALSDLPLAYRIEGKVLTIRSKD